MSAKKNPSQHNSTKSNAKTTSPSVEKLKNLKQSTTELDQKISELESKLVILEAEKEDWKSKSIRYAADLQNAFRQNELDVATGRKNSKKQTILSIVPFLNTLNIAFNYIPPTEDPKIMTFISTLKTSFEKVIKDLAATGIEILTTQSGSVFDPEIMTILNSDITSDSGEVKVKQVVSIGLKIDNQLIQPISVIVE